MLRQLSNLNRFLYNQSFYPILLSSIFAISLFVTRAIYSSTWVVYLNLVWNLVLAWVPFTFSIFTASLHRTFPKQWALLVVPAGVWLVFFPNAPYILTDFFHFTPRNGVALWYDLLLLAAFSWTGIFLAIASLRTMQIIARAYIGKPASWLFTIFALGLSGLGIYLGRFERWNSWDLLFQPKTILADVAVRFMEPLENLRFFGFSILFTGFLFLVYIMFISQSRFEETEI